MTTSAEAAFREVSSMLDACKKERDSMPAVLVAESVGFRRDKNADPQVIVSLVFEDDAGSSVTLTERRHDPSGSLQNLPDIHRLRLVLNVGDDSSVWCMVEY